MRRGSITLYAGALAAFALGALLFAMSAAPVQQRLAVAALNAAGYGAAGLAVERVDWRQARLRNVSVMDGAVRAAEIVLDYAPSELLFGHVERISVTGLQVQLDISQDGAAKTPFPTNPQSDAGYLTVAEIVLREAAIALATPLGAVRLDIDGALRGEPAAWEGTLDLQARHDSAAASARLHLRGTAPARLALVEANWTGPQADLKALSGSAEIDLNAKQASVTLAAKSGRWATTAFGPATLTGAFRLDDAALAVAEPLRLNLDRLRIAAAAAKGPVELAIPAATVRLGEGSPIFAADFAVSPVNMLMQTTPFSFAGASGRVSGRGAQADAELELSGVRIGAPPWLAPAHVRGNLAYQVGAPLAFDLRATAAVGAMVVEAAGEHDLESGAGGADLTLHRLNFMPGGLQPSDIVPRLDGRVSDASGTVALDGRAEWSGRRGAVSGDVDLLLQGLSFKAGALALARLNGVIGFDSLWPLSTRPAQRLAVGLIDVGMPLTDAIVEFDLPPAGDVTLALRQLGLAGGQVSTETIRVRRTTGAFSTVFNVRDVDLGTALKLSGLEGLAATGKLDGKIPVDITKAGIAIKDGLLRAHQPGALRYRPAEPPAALRNGGEGAALMLAALQNFHYQELWLDLNRERNGETIIGLHIEGANPDIYDGYPIELNVNLSGPLDRIVQQSLQGYRVPEQIRQRMLEFGK